MKGSIKKAESLTAQSLKNSELRYRRLFEAAQDGILILDARTGMIEDVNPYLIKMLGYSRTEFIKKKLWEVGAFLDIEASQEAFEALQKNEYIRYEDLPLKTKDGRLIQVEFVSNVYLVGEEKVIQCNIRDITNRKDAERSVAEGEKRYRTALNNMMEGCQVIDYDWRYIYVNDAVAKQGRKTPVELLMHTMMDAYPGIENTELFHKLQTVMENRIPQRIENEFFFSDGTSGWFELSIQPVPEGIFILSFDITEHKRAEQKIKRRAAEFEALYQSGIAFGQTLDQRDLGEKVIEVLSTQLDWHHAAVRVKHASSDEVELIAYMHPGEEQDGGLRMQSAITREGEGLAGWVIQNEKPLRINNLTEDPRYVATFDGMNSGLYVPMQTYNETIGCISVESDQLNAFTEEDEHLLTTFALQAAVAIKNAELFEELQIELAWRKQSEEKNLQQLGRFAALNEIDYSIISSFDLRFSLGTILTHVMVQLEVDATDVLLLNRDTQVLEFFTGRGFRTKAVREARVSLGESYAGRAALERHLVQIPNLRDEPDNLFLTTLLAGEDFFCYYGLPLISQGRVSGVLEVFHRAPLEPDADWLNFFTALAGQTAIAIENVTLFSDLQRSNSELMLAYETTLDGWSRALDLRDKETEGHTQRVTEMAIRLSRAFGLSEMELVDVRRGALLHDIGKMGVPDHILLKPGELTEQEWEQMRMHPVYAYELLSHIAYLQDALNIPHYHHEKWDGSGYPEGLKGAQIPLVARIFAVVDVWDAMTSDRPYRLALTKDKAREYIRTSAGKQFDPQVVDMFMRVFQ